MSDSTTRTEPPEGATDADKQKTLPKPAGWRILCAMPNISEKVAGTTLDLVVDPQSLRFNELATVTLFVLSVGPEAYKNTEKFPTGPWCKPGDFILTRTYAGTRFRVFGKEFRLINDDQVEAVVEDPCGITRV